MKIKFISYAFFIATVAVILSFSITGCTKTGPEGYPGKDGEDGQDADATCQKCHDFSENLLAKIFQYNNSVHAGGYNVSRNGEGCSHCHTSKGFRDFLSEGKLALVENPTPVNCRTCHKIHETYSPADYALRTTDGVVLTLGDATFNYGSSNICSRCHQARPVSPYPVAGGPDVTITNQRYGPHYGTQSNIFLGKGPFEVAGSMPYLNSAHTSVVTNGCVTCHMSTAVGSSAGGHQMNVGYTTLAGSKSYNLSGCTECHSNTSTVSAMLTANRTEISSLLAQLKQKLVDKGFLDASDLVIVPLTVSPNEAGAIMNYKFVYNDQSYGAHNYLYAKALLVNSLEALHD